MAEQLDIIFRTWQQASAGTLRQFHNLIREHPLLRPEEVGPYEPLEYDFDDFTPESLAQLVLDEESLLVHRNEEPIQHIHFSNRASPRALNVFDHSIEGVERKSEQARTFCDYAFELFSLFEPAYGRVCCKGDFQDKNQVPGSITPDTVGIDLRQYLPGLYWANFFGPAYIEFFGEEKLLNAPAHEVRWLGDAGILLLVSESPFEYGTPEVVRRERAIIDYLGPEAFFSKSDPESKEYVSPDFQSSAQRSNTQSNGAQSEASQPSEPQPSRSQPGEEHPFTADAIEIRSELVEPIESDPGAVIDQLSTIARRHAELCRTHFDVELGFEEASFEQLDTLIDQGWPDRLPSDLEPVVMSFGSFTGECIRELQGGRWAFDEELGYHLVEVGGQDMKVFPFDKVQKRFVNGEEDALAFYYETLCQLVGGEDERGRGE